MIYSESEIRRIAKVAFDIAGKRDSRVCSIDKANVLDVSQVSLGASERAVALSL